MDSFIIPLELIDLNTYINAERRNKFIAAKMKTDSTNAVMLFCKNLSLVQDKQHDVIINWHTKDKRKDSDNVFFASKFIFDGIVKAGKLSGDGYKQIRNIHHNRLIGESKVEVTFKEVLC